MSRIPHALAFAAMALPASAAAPPAGPDWSQARQIEIVLANFEYRPKTLTLKAGEPVILTLRNRADNGHDFTARTLFRKAAVRSGDMRYIRDGSVEVPPGGHRSIGLIPAAGRYGVKCTHSFHHMLGMGGEIVVQ
ncbi:cupredoxin domain-containing protein [Allosphingosinicella flava]|uniref:Cupredoxin domain-containing protein n=1 Tax=Allosphingosinicella flava TaxID=2771430 RepID=A0A7T2GJ44_9SPHN|nr:cupredoxin domain-containing protein [Sphingosinicella flava]QPQ54824.1 cupredoxin domain-containing protein [Sphingosinicella flava]